nr:transposase [Mesorhizobium caraganae]
MKVDYSTVWEFVHAEGLSIRQAGAKLFFLLKYSPDFNPIEQIFAKLKHWLRKAAKRTVETVGDVIGHILNCVTPVECSNYLTKLRL